MVVGEHDDVTPPWLSERYQAAAAQLRKKIKLTRVMGKGHNIFLDPTVIGELDRMLEVEDPSVEQ